MSKPSLNRGDVVYLKSSAEIGRLEPFKISGAKQVDKDVWLYQVEIHKKPPRVPTIGDKVRPKFTEPDLYYKASEFISLCDALDIAISRLETQLQSVELFLADCSETDLPVLEEGSPKFEIGDRVWFNASAKIGFFESDTVTEILEIGIQPGSTKRRFQYTLNIVPDRIVFREDELITKCEAGKLVKSAIERQLAEMQSKRTQYCI